MKNLQSIIAAFLRTQKLCVVSTVNDANRPQSALVAFSEHEDLRIVIGTFNDTRKYANLLHDPHVSIVVASEETSLQLEGIATQAEGDEIVACTNLHLTKNPSSKKYANDPRQRFFIIKPTWMRFTDHSVDPHVVEELSI